MRPLDAVAVSDAGLPGDGASDSTIAFQLLDGPVPAPIVMPVIPDLTAASLTTVSETQLATSTIIVGSVLHVHMLRAVQLAIVPVAPIGILVAVRVHPTGILLALTFELLCAIRVAPFVLYLCTHLTRARALVISTVLGRGTRLASCVLTPTIYGVVNALLYNPIHRCDAERRQLDDLPHRGRVPDDLRGRRFTGCPRPARGVNRGRSRGGRVIGERPGVRGGTDGVQGRECGRGRSIQVLVPSYR